MRSTRREFHKHLGAGVLLGSGLLAAGGARAQERCKRVNGAGSYLLGPFDPLEAGKDPVFLVTDMGFDETMVFCKVSTNYQPFRFPTASLGVVEFAAHEFFMDMKSVWIKSLEVEEANDGPVAVFDGFLRSETRLFSGEKAQTVVEKVAFGCRAKPKGPEGNIEVSETNFSMTAHFDPHKEHAAIFGEEVTFAGQVTQGNIIVVS